MARSNNTIPVKFKEVEQPKKKKGKLSPIKKPKYKNIIIDDYDSYQD